MQRWEVLVLNKIYKTEIFSEITNRDKPCIIEIQEIVSRQQPLNLVSGDIMRLATQILTLEDSKVLFSTLREINCILPAENFFTNLNSFGFLDVIVYSALSRCKIWPKIFKEFRGKSVRDKQSMQFVVTDVVKQKKKSELSPLLEWYSVFLNQFQSELEWKFDKGILPNKYVKMVERRRIDQKSNPEFFQAIKQIDLEKLQQMIERDGLNDLMDCLDNGTLKRGSHFACETGSMKLIRFLDQFGVVRWDELDGENQTPLFFAVQANSLEVIRFLIEEKGVDQDPREIQNRTPFYQACFLGYLPILEYLFVRGVDINILSKLKRTPLTKACYLNHVEIVKWLTSREGIDILLQDVKGRSALHNAAWGSSGGKDGKKRGDTILPDSPQSVICLLALGHPVDLLDHEGNSALQSASSSNAYDSLHILIEHGADPDQQNKYGETPLWLAARYGHYNIVHDLAVKYGCSISAQDKKQMCPMVASLVFGSPNLTELLIEWLVLQTNGIKIDKQTPQIDMLHIQLICQQYGRRDQFGWLLKHIIKYNQHLNFKISLFFILGQEDQYDLLIRFIIEQDNQSIQDSAVEFSLQLIQNTQDLLLKLVYSLLLKGDLISVYHHLYKSNQKHRFNWINQIIPAQLVVNSIKTHLMNQHQVTDSELIQLILDLNIDSLVYVQDNMLQVLVKHRRTKAIVDLISSTNPTVMEHVRRLAITRDSEALSPSELALIMKYKDIAHIINSLGIQQLGDVVYRIPSYSFELQQRQTVVMKQLSSKEVYTKSLQTEEQIEKQTFSLVDSEDKLDLFCSQIQNYQLFGVDVEFFQENENVAIVCTIQISTPSISAVIDCWSLRSIIPKSFIKILLEDAQKVKVFHGCDSDLRWLSVNFGIEVRGLYDTARAESIITQQKQSQGLMQLSQKYLQLKMDKDYQKADWRIRPLPQSMINYAIEDSNVLIPIFHKQMIQMQPIHTQDLMDTCVELSNKYISSQYLIVQQLNN